MKKIMMASFGVFAVLLGLQAKAEESVGYIGEVATSNKSIEFLTTDGESGGKTTFAPKIITLDYSGTIIYQDYYARVKISQTISDDVILAGDMIIMSRSDLDFTLGYYIGNGVSAFVGHKRGEFEAFVSGDAVAASTANLRVRFTDSGPFVGLSYSLPMDKSSLSLTLAYADMGGEINFNTRGSSITTTGDTTGFSYSVAWSKPVSESTNFIAALNIVRYDFDDKTDAIGVDFSTEQNFDAISVGLLHYF